MTEDNNNLNTNRPITRSSASQASTMDINDEQINPSSDTFNSTLNRSVPTGGDVHSSASMDVQKLATEFDD